MKRHIILIYVFLANIVCVASAQNYDQYQTLKGEGNIPEVFISSSTQKYNKAIKKIKSDKKRRDKQAFLLQSNFSVDEILQSGLVLFNDPVSIYLNEVLQKLIVDNDKLKNVKVYALRTSAVNAFATDRGDIFVSLGLLAQLEDEAQLAFILSHELTHVEEGHNIDLFLKSKEISKSIDKSKAMKERAFDVAMLSKHNYSKELESEADNKGFERLVQKTKYSAKSLNTVFDVLKYSYLPFDEVAFKKSFFEDEAYVLPDKFYLNQVQAIKGAKEDEDDSKSSHPNIAKRREAFLTAVKNVDESSRQTYLISKERFANLRQVCRYEVCMLYLRDDEFTNAIYAAHVLLNEHPESIYLKKIIAKALYVRAKMANDDDNYITIGYKQIEGESQRVAFLLDTLSAKEITVLALRYAYKLHKANPNDVELSQIVDDLYIESANYWINLNDFSNKKPNNDIADNSTVIAPEIDTVQKEKTKYDKIKASRNPENPLGTESAYWKYAFVGMLEDTAFTKGYERGVAKNEQRKKDAAFYKTEEGRVELRKEAAKKEKRGVSLGIDKIVVLTPYYLKVKQRNSGNITQYISMEESQEELRSMIEIVAATAKLDVEVLDVHNLKTGDTEKFNDIVSANEWIAEQFAHDDLSLTPGYNQERINQLAKKYGTDYFLWTGVVSLKRHKPGVAGAIVLGTLIPFFMPFTLYYVIKPFSESFLYSVLYDVRTGRHEVINYNFIRAKDRSTWIKGHLYDGMNQIKRKPKK